MDGNADSHPKKSMGGLADRFDIQDYGESELMKKIGFERAGIVLRQVAKLAFRHKFSTCFEPMID